MPSVASDDVVPAALQRRLEKLADLLLVVDDEDEVRSNGAVRHRRAQASHPLGPCLQAAGRRGTPSRGPARSPPRPCRRAAGRSGGRSEGRGRSPGCPWSPANRRASSARRSSRGRRSGCPCPRRGRRRAAGRSSARVVSVMRAAGRRVLHRVAQQVRRDLRHAVAVGLDLRQVGLQVERQGVVRRVRAHAVGGVVDDRVEVDRARDGSSSGPTPCGRGRASR